MSIIDMPTLKVQECTFSLIEGAVSTPFNRGKSFNVTSVFDPTWAARVETAPLDRDALQTWHSWKVSLRGGINRFRAYDRRQLAPLAYIGANSPAEIAAGWSGTATVTSLGLGGALVLGAVPAGYLASSGDRVELSQNGITALYELTANAAATSGGALSLTVQPLLHTEYFNTSAVARLWRPRAVFIMDHTSWSHRVVADPTPASFDGYQVLK